MSATETRYRRRDFLASLAAAGTAAGAASVAASIAAGGAASALGRSALGRSSVRRAALPVADADSPRAGAAGIKLGFDNFSIRAFGWKAPRLLEHAASLKVDTLLVSDLDSFESLDDEYLNKVRAQAESLGVELQVGTGSVCPTSSRYDEKRWGPAEKHVELLLRVAKALGSRVARCYLGHGGDRQGDGGIQRHIDSMARVLRGARGAAEAAGVRIAVENHAGDMQAWELAGLIEAAGKGHVGATLDSGNAVWTVEDPLVNLEILGPYAVTTGMRDSAAWETERGASVMWANMGQGVVDWKAYVKRFGELCPGVPFVLEILSYTWLREIPYLEAGYWDAFPRARASEFARFVALVKRGKPYTVPAGRPSGPASRELEQAQQAFDLEESLRYSREVLGLGVRG